MRRRLDSVLLLAGLCACRGAGWPGAARPAQHAGGTPIAFSEAGYVEIDRRLRLALPEMLRLDGGRPRPEYEVVRRCEAPARAEAKTPRALVDETLPRALCVLEMLPAQPGTGAFVRVYLDPQTPQPRVIEAVARHFAAAVADAGAGRSVLAPLAHGGWSGLRGRVEREAGLSRSVDEVDFIVVARDGGGVFIVATSVFDSTRLELSQRRPTP